MEITAHTITALNKIKQRHPSAQNTGKRDHNQSYFDSTMSSVSVQSMSKTPREKETSVRTENIPKATPQHSGDGIIRKNSELSVMLARSLTFNIVRVEKECGKEVASNILRIVTDDNFNPNVLRNTASTVEECNEVVEDEIRTEKLLGNYF